MVDQYKPDFRHRHPVWTSMINRWNMSYDFWRSGIHVLNPDHDIDVSRVARVNEYSSDADGTSPELTQPSSPYEWVPFPVRSYLHKNDNETGDEFRNRSKRQVHFPLFQGCGNIFTSGIMKTGPRRDPTGLDVEPWKTFWLDTDLVGTNIDALVRRALALGMVFGRCHGVVDTNKSVVLDSAARADMAGKRPYVNLVTPIDFVDWGEDENGILAWAVIREDEPDLRRPGEKPPDDVVSQYRVWYPDHWELWRDRTRSQTIMSEPAFELDDEGGHNVGRVPIETLWVTRVNRAANMACESPLSSVLDFDRHFLNKMSELDENERAGTFAMLWLPEVDGISSGPADVSPFRAFTGSAHAGAPQWIAPPDELPSGKWARINGQMFAIRQMASVGRGGAEGSREERSAAAISVESEDKRNQMATWAAATEEFDRGLHRLVNLWSGRDPEDYPEMSYSRDYDFKALATQINELVQLNSTQALSPDALAILAKPIVTKMMREFGMPQDEIAAAEAAVVEQAKKVARDQKQQKQDEAAAKKAQTAILRGRASTGAPGAPEIPQ